MLAQGISCLNNVRQLKVAWQIWASFNPVFLELDPLISLDKVIANTGGLQHHYKRVSRIRPLLVVGGGSFWLGNVLKPNTTLPKR